MLQYIHIIYFILYSQKEHLGETKESVKLCKATVFLSLQTLNKLASMLSASGAL